MKPFLLSIPRIFHSPTILFTIPTMRISKKTLSVPLLSSQRKTDRRSGTKNHCSPLSLSSLLHSSFLIFENPVREQEWRPPRYISLSFRQSLGLHLNKPCVSASSLWQCLSARSPRNRDTRASGWKRRRGREYGMRGGRRETRAPFFSPREPMVLYIMIRHFGITTNDAIVYVLRRSSMSHALGRGGIRHLGHARARARCIWDGSRKRELHFFDVSVCVCI